MQCLKVQPTVFQSIIYVLPIEFNSLLSTFIYLTSFCYFEKENVNIAQSKISFQIWLVTHRLNGLWACADRYFLIGPCQVSDRKVKCKA